MKQGIIILLLLIFAGCNPSGKPKKPDNLIPKDKMVNIMYDAMLLSSAKGINKKILETNGILPEEYLFKKYGIDSLQFALSNDYYTYDTKTYEGIMAQVKAKVETEKEAYEKRLEKETKTKDSLMRATKQKFKDSINITPKEKLKQDTTLQKIGRKKN